MKRENSTRGGIKLKQGHTMGGGGQKYGGQWREGVKRGPRERGNLGKDFMETVFFEVDGASQKKKKISLASVEDNTNAARVARPSKAERKFEKTLSDKLNEKASTGKVGFHGRGNDAGI